MILFRFFSRSSNLLGKYSSHKIITNPTASYFKKKQFEKEKSLKSLECKYKKNMMTKREIIKKDKKDSSNN